MRGLHSHKYSHSLGGLFVGHTWARGTQKWLEIQALGIDTPGQAERGVLSWRRGGAPKLLLSA